MKEATSTTAGQSIIEQLWAELMTVADRLYTGAEAEDGRDPGRAEGIAFCVAVMVNPYKPDIEAIRTEVTRRWREQNEQD